MVQQGDDFAGLRLSRPALISHTARKKTWMSSHRYCASIEHQVLGGTELDITNEELANTASLSLLTASRLLSELQRERRISKRGSKRCTHDRSSHNNNDCSIFE
jgi:CRP-like cAMP-binding protein